MPRASALARNAATHWSNGSRVLCARAGAGSASAVAQAKVCSAVRRVRWNLIGLPMAEGLDSRFTFRLYSALARSRPRDRWREAEWRRSGQRGPGQRDPGWLDLRGRGRDGDLRLLLDLRAAAADQPLIGGHQGHIGVDENPAVFGWRL